MWKEAWATCLKPSPTVPEITELTCSVTKLVICLCKSTNRNTGRNMNMNIFFISDVRKSGKFRQHTRCMNRLHKIPMTVCAQPIYSDHKSINGNVRKTNKQIKVQTKSTLKCFF